MLEPYVRACMTRLARTCAQRRLLVISFALTIIALTGIGIRFMVLEEDPAKLWVESHSQVAQEKKIYDETFSPFYRTEQILLTPKKGHNTTTNAAVLQELGTWLTRLHNEKTSRKQNLGDFCWRMIPGKGCFELSPLSYFQGNATKVSEVEQTFPGGTPGFFHYCTTALHSDCFSELGIPVQHYTVFGGEHIEEDADTNVGLHAQASMVTLLLNNSVEGRYLADVMEWERDVFVRLMEAYAASSELVNVFYMSERSVQDALKVQESSSAANIAISYIVMFLYITCALGYFHRVHSKAAVAFCGVVLVLCSLIFATGLCSFAGVSLTLIITDVVPFLVLAIGVDNMFIISSAYWNAAQRLKSERGVRTLSEIEVIDVMSKAVGEVGGTMLLAGMAEFLAFSLGGLTSMPAVRAFSFYSAASIGSNLILQLTVFIAILTMDALRVERRTSEIPCLPPGKDDSEETTELRQIPFTEKEDIEEELDRNYWGIGVILRRFMRRIYCPYILESLRIRTAIIIAFLSLSCVLLLVGIPQAKLGLDIKDPVPENHYLMDFFVNYETYGQSGPPLYFVNKPKKDHTGRLRAINYTDPHTIHHLSQLNSVLQNETPFVVPQSVAFWYSDFRRFLCHNANATVAEFRPGNGCVNYTVPGNPEADLFAYFQCDPYTMMADYIPPDDFPSLLRQFRDSPQCCLSRDRETGQEGNTGICGFQYTSEIDFGKCYTDAHDNHVYLLSESDKPSVVPENTTECVRGSRIRTQTTKLTTSEDYIGSFLSAHNATRWFNHEIETDGGNAFTVFPYSIYFLYYAQYESLANTAGWHVGTALTVTALVSFAMLGSLSTTVFVLLTLVMILVDLVAVMSLWGVRVNAISVVNLVMAVGISVEFCVHMAMGYQLVRGSAGERMRRTMVDVGTNVFCGITLTKLLGVCVLNFSPSLVFRIYYFRMYLAIIVLGGLHGLLFLPAMLAQFGAPSVKQRVRWFSW